MSSQIANRSTEAFFKPARQFPKRGPNGFPIGPRTERRASENRELNKLQIRHCEIQISHNCARTSMLSWAHSQKSRFLVTKADWQEAARCCIPCHQEIEAMSHAEMKRLICEAIKRRKP